MTVDRWETISAKTYDTLLSEKTTLHTTWCNYAARIFAQEHGVTGPFVMAEHNTNVMFDQLKKGGYDTDTHRFRMVTWQEAEKYAAHDGFAIVIHPDHIATVVGGYKGKDGERNNLIIFQAGVSFGEMKVRTGFPEKFLNKANYYIWERK